MTASVTHFEIYAEDLDEARRLLQGALRLEDRQGARDRLLPDRDRPAREPAASAAGILHRPIPGPRSWVHYVSVDSIDETVERVQRLGGKLVRAKAAVPKIAWYAVVEDPEGNVFAIWQADATAFPPLEPED